MSFWDDLLAARATEVREQQELAQAQAEYDQAVAERKRLEGLAVPDFADVSEFQGDIDWPAYKTASSFAIMRVNDGDYRDARFTKARVTSYRSAGLQMVGVYSFGRCAAPVNGERDGFLEAAMSTYWAWEYGTLRKGDLPLVYDFEKSAAVSTDSFNGQPADKAAKHVVQFITGYRSLRGHSPIVYTNPATWSLLRPTLSDTDLAVIASCPLWQAEWSVTMPRSLNGLQSALMHQYTNQARFAGVSAPCDGNRFLGSKADLEALRIT